MIPIDVRLSRFSSFRIVLFYAIFSGIYIYTSDYLLESISSDGIWLTKLQTYKGLGFILITSILLYILVKRNIDVTSSYYKQIIEVKQANEIQIQNSQNEYMSLFNHSPIPMWIFDRDTLDILHVNESACSIYGYTEDEYKTMNLRDIRPIEDIPILEQHISESYESEKLIIPTVVRHQKKNGEIMYVKVKNALVTYENRTVRLASAIDFSSEMNTQNALMETNAKLQLASEIANLGYWTNDFIKNEIQWSDELYRIFELNPESFELNLENIASRFHPEDQLNFNQDLFSLFEKNNIFESEHRIITDSGKVKWILERQYLIKDLQGKPIKLEGIALDITKRKLHEQEIESSNERFRILAKATVEAIIDWDILNNKVIWGEGFHTLLGYDLGQSDNRLWSKNIHPEDRKMVLDELSRTLNDPEKVHFYADFRFLKANKDVTYVQLRGVFIRDEKGKATRALGAMIDLTEALDRMRKIELQNKALREIAWTQSHIVRAPLANIIGLIDLLIDKQHKDEDSKLLSFISDSAEKLDLIINDIVKKSSEINEIE
jgi:PAS domain S-box-containing protein